MTMTPGRIAPARRGGYASLALLGLVSACGGASSAGPVTVLRAAAHEASATGAFEADLTTLVRSDKGAVRSPPLTLVYNEPDRIAVYPAGSVSGMPLAIFIDHVQYAAAPGRPGYYVAAPVMVSQFDLLDVLSSSRRVSRAGPNTLVVTGPIDLHQPATVSPMGSLVVSTISVTMRSGRPYRLEVNGTVGGFSVQETLVYHDYGLAPVIEAPAPERIVHSG